MNKLDFWILLDNEAGLHSQNLCEEIANGRSRPCYLVAYQYRLCGTTAGNLEAAKAVFRPYGDIAWGAKCTLREGG